MRGLIFALAAAFMFWSAPASAQDVDQAQAQEDMECLVWVAFIGGLMEDEDPIAAQGMAIGVAYFAGHYEATTGQSVSDNWDPSILERVAINPQAYSTRCGRRMEAVGGALQTLSDQISSADRQGGPQTKN